MKNLVATAFLLIVLLCSKAQPGSNDIGFNTVDNCTFGPGFNNVVKTTIIQPDGKILVGGHFTQYNGHPVGAIARLNTDGSLDTAFSAGTGFSVGTPYLESIDLQADGKIIAGGDFSEYDGAPVSSVVRLNADGTLDNAFSAGTGTSNVVNCVKVQPDGKIVIGGSFVTFNGSAQNRIARLNTDGSVDATFITGTGFDNIVYTLTLQPDGKILVGGNFNYFNGIFNKRIARLNADGSEDVAFSPPGSSFNGGIYTISVQPDNKLVIGGWYNSFDGNPLLYITRLNADGSMDAPFNQGGFDYRVNTTSLQTDGKIIAAGYFTAFNGTPVVRIARLNIDGSLDGSFDPGAGFDDKVYTSAIQADGKIIVGGTFTTYDGATANYFTRLNSDGTIDNSFNTNTGFNNTTYTAALQVDDKILVGGSFGSFNGVSSSHISRLNLDGSIDISFNVGDGFNDTVFAIAMQTDGKIIVGGNFTNYDGISVNRIARLNTDGSLDNSFITGNGFDAMVRSIAIQPDGKVVVGGNFTTYNLAASDRIVRLNSDGTVDAGFSTGTGFDGVVNTIRLQADGKIISCGAFTDFNGTSSNKIARLNADGGLDLSFTTGTGFNNTTYDAVIQPDNKIIVGGSFTSFNGTAANRIVRLNDDGTMDPTLNTGSGLDSTAYSLVLQPSEKIIAAGAFGNYNGSTANRIVRLTSDGAVDVTFDTNTGFNDDVFAIVRETDGQVVAAGKFSAFNSYCRNHIARLSGEDVCMNTSSTIDVDECNSYVLNGVTYTTDGTYTQVIPNVGGCDSTITLILTMLPVTTSTIWPYTCTDYTINGDTFTTSGTYYQTIPNTVGCDSIITINLTINPIDMTVDQVGGILISVETVADFQWLDCLNGYSEIVGEVTNLYEATTVGSYAIRIEQFGSGCVDTSDCIDVDIWDLSGTAPGPLSAEVFALPVSDIDTCDALALAFAWGGIPPYEYDWFTQQYNENSDILDSLCEGFHTLKIMDALGDSVLVDYYVTDFASFWNWYDTTFTGFVDTIYIAAVNCALDYSAPLDSANISDLFFIGDDTIPSFDLYFIEITYYQAGVMYIHQDTISIDVDGWYLIDFSVYCPIKSFNKIKTILLDVNYPAFLGQAENSGVVTLVVYPNPTDCYFTISGMEGANRVNVMNAFGVIVYSEMTVENMLSIDLSELANGLYFVQVVDSEESRTTSVIKN